MGLKSRGNWQNNMCFKDCANRDIKCDECFNPIFKHFIPNKKEETKDEN